MATPRQVRWATHLSEFDFGIRYAPGITNVVADALSRAAAGEAPAREPSAPRLLLGAITEMAPMPVRIRRAAAADATYQEMLGRDVEYLRSRNLRKVEGLLYRDTGAEDGEQLVVPENAALRAWIISWCHDAREGGHRAGERMC